MRQEQKHGQHMHDLRRIPSSDDISDSMFSEERGGAGRGSISSSSVELGSVSPAT